MLAAVVSAVIQAGVAAQGFPPFSDGPLVAMPSTFSVDRGTSLAGSDERAAQPFLKPRGFVPPGSPPPPLTTPSVDFSVKALFRTCTPAGSGIASGPVPEVDAISLGLDVLPVTSQGELVVAGNRWTAMEFSVRDGTTGVTGSRLNDELSRPGGNRADFFGFVFVTSACIPPEAQGETFKAADSLDAGLPLDAEVDGIDVYANLYELGSPFLVNLPALPSFYFSLEGSATNLALVPAAWWGGTTPSGATVFKSDWTGSGWTCPAVFVTASDLGLMDCEDVDALAIEVPKVVFSTSTTNRATCIQRDQILFVDLSAESAIPVTLSNGGEPVWKSIGLIENNPIEDVDALCVFDPICSGNRPPGRPVAMENAMGHVWAAPGPGFPFPRQLEAQAYRAPAPGQGYRYELYALGGPPGGVGIWAFTVPQLWPQLLVAVSFGVPTGSPHAGDPVQLQFGLQPNVRGADLVAHAFTLTPSAPFVLSQGHPVNILLR